MRGRKQPGEVFGTRMSLFADVLSIGMVTALVSLPLVTAPAALSTACAVLRGAAEHRPSTAGRYVAELRARFRAGDVGAGAVLLLALGLVAADAALAGAGLPGAAVFAGAAGLFAAGALAVGLRACGRAESVTDWRAALRAAVRDATYDLPGTGLVLLAVATCGLCTWMMLPLAFLVPGPLALALVAVEGRRRGAGAVAHEA
ncbi:hypothetical protein [Streptomyces fractus]|uniref:hypothetical protein n=1 Tax=Streptomyces fractus TaxID=641806 RepID=UPI003CEC97C1